ncbi:MAG TPA: DUF6056 family protein [Pyrinomonadaceae bacterium]|nr:DUF6056 family protein [Pyrinomonadaceae bacterium]
MRYSRRIFFWLLLALFCAPLVIHIYLGSYSRFIADDFCSSALARSQGILRGALFWYINWNGRFSANFLDSLFGYLGPAATPYATGLFLTLWFIALAIAVAQLLPSVSDRETRLLQSGIISAMVLFAVLHVLPLVGQSLYWGQGMRSVVPPLILGSAYLALIANHSKSSERTGLFWLITAALVTFIAVGFAETYFAVQTTALLFALVIPAAFKRYAPPNKRNYFLLLIAGLVGSLAGGLIMFVAPGNKFRQNAFPPPPAIPELLSISLRGLSEFFELVVQGKWFVWVGIILCGFIFGLDVFQRREGSSTRVRRDVWIFIWLPVIGFVLLLACWVPMAWGTSLILAYRTFIIPAYVMVCVVACWSYLAGRVCRSAYDLAPRAAIALPVIGLLAFGVFAAKITREMWRQRALFAGYARRFDEREQTIARARSQGLPYAVVLRQHNWAGLDEIAVDPKITWLTKCVRDYYGINVIPDLGDLYGEPDGPAKQAALERQFDAITKLPGSVPTELNQIYKTDRGKIGFYKTELNPAQIKSYYDDELPKRGWKYIGEKKVEAFQKFSGGSQFLYCNGEVAATLFTTAKDEAWLGYTYSLALNWGMSSGYQWGVVDCLPK